MNIKNLSQVVKNFLFELFGKESDIVAVIPIEKGWQVTAEILMDEEYTMKRGRSDLLHVYEIIVDPGQNVVSYVRTRVRERGKIDE